MKEQFDDILEQHGFLTEDIEDILYAVSEMLECAAERLKKEEPYAVNSIASMEGAANEVFCLTNYI